MVVDYSRKCRSFPLESSKNFAESPQRPLEMRRCPSRRVHEARGSLRLVFMMTSCSGLVILLYSGHELAPWCTLMYNMVCFLQMQDVNFALLILCWAPHTQCRSWYVALVDMTCKTILINMELGMKHWSLRFLSLCQAHIDSSKLASYNSMNKSIQVW